MDFRRYIHSDIVVEEVLLTRATSKQAEDFKKILVDNINSGTRKMVVDLTSCEYIDSAFTGAIVVSLRTIAALGGDLRLVGLQPEVLKMFVLTRVVRQFDVFQTIDAAIESYRGQGIIGLRDKRLILH